MVGEEMAFLEHGQLCLRRLLLSLGFGVWGLGLKVQGKQNRNYYDMGAI